MVGILHPTSAVEWNKKLVQACDSTGRTVLRWVTYGMPKLGPYRSLLDSVSFLYESADDARRGVRAGGTSFFVSIPSINWPHLFQHTYAITNWHVACQAGASFIRVNRIAGQPDVIERDPSEWDFIPGGNDIAVTMVTLDLRVDEHKVQTLGPSFFLTKEQISSLEIDAGDDLMMLGRFIDYDGVDSNKPSVRFGHISMMDAPVIQLTNSVQPSHIADMHSRTGYSGSPVFVYRTHGSIFASKDKPFVIGGHLFMLLGILWGQFPEEWEVKKKDISTTKSSTKKNIFVIDCVDYIKGMSGMCCLCPSSAIWEVLHMQKLVKQRAEIEANLAASGFGRGAPVPQVEPPASGGNPTHREDFTHLLNVAVKPPPQE